MSASSATQQSGFGKFFRGVVTFLAVQFLVFTVLIGLSIMGGKFIDSMVESNASAAVVNAVVQSVAAPQSYGAIQRGGMNSGLVAGDDIVGAVDVNKMAAAIHAHECPLRYDCRGKDGEYGAYQIIMSYWPTLSRQAFGDVRPPTPENQDAVAKAQIRKLASQGRTVREIALIWNGGNTREKRGISKGGIPYDTGAYADWVVRKYRSL